VHKSLGEGYTDVVDVDLSKCFDTILHCEMLQCVARQILDGYVLRLIKAWLRFQWTTTGNVRRQAGGITTPGLFKVQWSAPCLPICII
jgi:hypothetical protein